MSEMLTAAELETLDARDFTTVALGSRRTMFYQPGAATTGRDPVHNQACWRDATSAGQRVRNVARITSRVAPCASCGAKALLEYTSATVTLTGNVICVMLCSCCRGAAPSNVPTRADWRQVQARITADRAERAHGR